MQPVPPSVKIGLVAPFEGRYRAIGYDVIYGARLAIREANAAGGVAGYTVELVAYDDGGEPRAAVAQARKLSVDPEVMGAIGHFREPTTLAALPAYAAATLPLIAPDCYGIEADGAPGEVFILAPPASVVADGILRSAVSSGSAVTVALVTDGGALGRAIRQAVQGSMTAVRLGVYSCDAVWLPSVLSAGADAVILDASPEVAGDAARLLREAGWPGSIAGGPALSFSDFAAVAGPEVSATCVTPWPLPQELADASAFVDAYSVVSGGVPPGRLALPAYEAAWLLIDALEAAILADGLPTRLAVARALEDTDRRGLLGQISFGSGHRWETEALFPCKSPPVARGD